MLEAFSSFTGLESPFNRFTEASVFNPITNLVPREAALAKYSICPLWRISKATVCENDLIIFESPHTQCIFSFFCRICDFFLDK